LGFEGRGEKDMKKLCLLCLFFLFLLGCATTPTPSAKQYNIAIQDFNKAIELDPNYAGAYLHRGKTFIKMGLKDKGCADLRKACELKECSGWQWAKKKGYCF